MVPSIDKICYQLPPENTACAYAHMLFCRGEWEEEMMDTFEPPVCMHQTLSEMVTEAIEKILAVIVQLGNISTKCNYEK